MAYLNSFAVDRCDNDRAEEDDEDKTEEREKRIKRNGAMCDTPDGGNDERLRLIFKRYVKNGNFRSAL